MDPVTITSFITGLFKPISDLVTGWQKRQQAKLESDLRINEAKTQGMEARLRTGQEADIAWENTSITNSGWKDEWFTVVLSIPAIMCFIPSMAKYVSDGFDALKGTPERYQWAFLVAVASSFGYKKIADFMALKKGV